MTIIFYSPSNGGLMGVKYDCHILHPHQKLNPQLGHTGANQWGIKSKSFIDYIAIEFVNYLSLYSHNNHFITSVLQCMGEGTGLKFGWGIFS